MLATGGVGKAWKFTSNSWECTGDGHASALRRGRRADRHGVHPVPSDRHGVAAQRARHPRHRGRARRRRHAQEQRGQALHVQLHPRVLQGRDGGQRGGGRRAGTRTRRTTAARPSSCRATRSRAPSTPRSRPAAAARTAACFLDIATRRSADYIKKHLPSMYHQFKELAGRRHHQGADGGRADLPLHHGRRPGRRRHAGDDGARPLRRRRGGRRACTAPTASAATRSPTCSCSAAAPGSAPREYAQVARRAAARRRTARSRRPAATLLAPFDSDRQREPVRDPRRPAGRACRRSSASSAPRTSCGRRSRRSRAQAAPGARQASRAAAQFNPGWHLALDLHSHAHGRPRRSTLGAIERKESRGGHTRDDYPTPTTAFGKVNVVHPAARTDELTVDPGAACPRCPTSSRQLLEEKK